MRLCGGLVGSTAVTGHSPLFHICDNCTQCNYGAQAVPLHLGVSHLETYLWPNPHDLGNLLPWSSKYAK